MLERKRANGSGRNARSPAHSRNHILQKSATSKQILLERSKNGGLTPKDKAELQRTYNEAYASSKEKLLISKIIALKKENNEQSLAFQRKEQALQHTLAKTQATVDSLKSMLEQLLPTINDHINADTKARISSLLHAGTIPGQRVDTSVQCDLLEADGSLGRSNKESTAPQSLGTDEEPKSGTEGSGFSLAGKGPKASTRNTHLHEVLNENDCVHRYIQSCLGQEALHPKKPPAVPGPVMPSFLKTLTIAQMLQ